MNKIVSVLRMSLVLLFANAAFADPPPERPDDYVKTLPKGQWVFAEFMWGEKKHCTPRSCMGGFYSPPLMLSVWKEKDSNDENNSVEIVATIEGCEPLGTNLIWEKDFKNLSRNDRIQYVESRVRSLSEKMAETCHVKLTEPVPLKPLDRLVP